MTNAELDAAIAAANSADGAALALSVTRWTLTLDRADVWGNLPGTHECMTGRVLHDGRPTSGVRVLYLPTAAARDAAAAAYIASMTATAQRLFPAAAQ